MNALLGSNDSRLGSLSPEVNRPIYFNSCALKTLLRQGCYSEEGDIVVLCAYLGQLERLRDILAGEVAVVIDEKDQAALDDVDSEGDSDKDAGVVSIERVNVTKRVSYLTATRMVRFIPEPTSHR
jgi:hypothetical protein